MSEPLPPGYMLDPLRPRVQALKGMPGAARSGPPGRPVPASGLQGQGARNDTALAGVGKQGAMPASAVADNPPARSLDKAALEALVAGGRVKRQVFENLQHGPLESLDALVLHRTGGGTAASTLSGYGNQVAGAHFLIDNDGTIYQTAEMGERTYHVGNIRSRAEVEGWLSKEDADVLRGISGGEKISYGERVRRISALEGKKSYPKRYPNNSNSIGIEVVGTYDKKALAYTEPTRQQRDSVRVLIEALKAAHGLTNEDIYHHGIISYKDAKGTEGRDLGY